MLKTTILLLLISINSYSSTANVDASAMPDIQFNTDYQLKKALNTCITSISMDQSDQSYDISIDKCQCKYMAVFCAGETKEEELS